MSLEWLPSRCHGTEKLNLSLKSYLKYQRNVSGIEERVIALYARGLATRDIEDQVREFYGINLSAEMVSKITDRIAPEIKECQQRPLEAVYLFIIQG